MSGILNKMVFTILLGFLLKITVIDDMRSQKQDRSVAQRLEVERQSQSR